MISTYCSSSSGHRRHVVLPWAGFQRRCTASEQWLPPTIVLASAATTWVSSSTRLWSSRSRIWCWIWGAATTTGAIWLQCELESALVAPVLIYDCRTYHRNHRERMATDDLSNRMAILVLVLECLLWPATPTSTAPHRLLDLRPRLHSRSETGHQAHTVSSIHSQRPRGVAASAVERALLDA